MAGLDRTIGLAKALFLVKNLPPPRNTRSKDYLDTKAVLGKLKTEVLRASTDLDMPAMYSIHGIDIHNTLVTSMNNNTITLIDAIAIIKAFNLAIIEIDSNTSKFPQLTEQEFQSIEQRYTDFINHANNSITSNGGILPSEFEKLKSLKDIAKKKFSQTYKIYANKGKNLDYTTILSWYSHLEKLTQKEIDEANILSDDYAAKTTPLATKAIGMLTSASLSMRMRANDIRSQEEYESFVTAAAASGKLKNLQNTQVYLNSRDIGSVKLATNSFSNFRDKINTLLKQKFDEVIKQPEYKDVALKSSNISKVFNWGHTAVETSPGKSRLISPKIVEQLVNVSSLSPEKMQIAEQDFQVQTGQIKSVIKMHQGLSSDNKLVMQLVIDSSIFQAVIVQETNYNNRVLAAEEVKWNLLDRAKNDSTFLARLGYSSIADLVVQMCNEKASPSLFDKVGLLIASSLTGKPNTNTKVTTKDFGSFISPFEVLKAVKKSKTVIPKTLKTGSGSYSVKPNITPSIRNTAGQFYSLASLQSLINDLLPRYMEKNMGTGSAKAVLNYRSGRLAESPKVERLSVSREGMISAFYSYMRNPYGTFSQGGAQGSPASRDPKLLISASIREIAATKVANRMRAVLI